MPGTVSVATSSFHRGRILSVLTLAFAMDPAVRWVYPEPRQYLDEFEEFVDGFAGGAFSHGSAYFVEGFGGAALWLPPGIHPDDRALGTLFDRTLPGRKGELERVFGEMDGHHPAEPHWYLPLMGVDPVLQGRGLGSALLREALARCDRDRSRAYLEATCSDNVALYERHGFEVRGTVAADGRTLVWPMVREPR